MTRDAISLPEAAPGRVNIARLVVCYAAIFAVFWYQALPEYTVTHRCLAFLVFLLGTMPLVLRLRRSGGAPLIELVSVQYAVLFALPIFYQSSLNTVTFGPILPSAEAVTSTLSLVLLAQSATLIGFTLGAKYVRLRVSWTQFEAAPERVFLFGVVCLALSWVAVGVSESFERPVKLVLSRPVGYSLLACLYWSRSVTGTQRRLIALIFVLATAYGALYSGSGEELVLPVVIWFLVRWLVGGRSPVAGFALLVALFFAIQPVKLLYRGAIRYEEGPANYTERLQLVSNIASSYWSMVSNDSEVLTQEIRRSGSERLSLLLSTATVVEQTPTSLPYLQGSTLTYLAVGWVPRFLWADKPTAYVANSTLPVRYGLQTAAGAERAMFSVGQLGEIYANFGPLAILPAFVFIGLIYSVPVAFVRRAPPIVQTAILMAVIVEMGPIGTSLAINFGGAPQLLIVQMLVLRFATSRRPGSAFGQSLTTSPVVGNR